VETAPVVSVIIPAYNAEKFVAEAIESSLQQTYPNTEVIVVDDGSTDDTPVVIRRHLPAIRYYRQANSGGCAVPRNTGIAHSSGALLCFLDADDVMLPDRVASQVDFLLRHPDVGLVFSDYRNFDESGPCPESHFETCPRLSSRLLGARELVLDDPRAHLTEENFGIAGSFLVRRKELNHAPGFEATLRACEDFHFYFRLARHTRVGLVNRIGMMRRLHQDNMSSDSARMLSEGIRSRALLRDGESDLVVRAGLERYIANCHAALAREQSDGGHYLRAVYEQCRALSSDRSRTRLREFAMGIARTGLMAVGARRDTAR
jgi:glycosyltransferase involved in cell wall biosynthesis